jgi:carbamoyl-phosphate synthase small subunit
VTNPGYLLLEDGRRFDGEMIGAVGETLGEAVFNTSMTGYQEVLTDPSYAGQIVSMTYPLIGNYGVNPTDEESGAVQVAGFVVREASRTFSNWRATGSVQAYLQDAGVVALDGVDTRALTRHLRSAGAMRAAIAGADTPQDELLARVRAHPRMEGLDLTCGVSTEEAYDVAPVGEARFRVLAYDFGVKRHSLKLLSERGCAITTLPSTTTAAEILERTLTASSCRTAPATLKRLATRWKPSGRWVSGVCPCSASAWGTSSLPGRSAARPTSCCMVTGRGTTRSGA